MKIECEVHQAQSESTYVVEVLTSLRQDGNGDWVSDAFTFHTKEDAERFAQQKSNGWVHCNVRRIGENNERK